MTMIVLIAIAAGCASALMFASIISGALISLVLLYFTPLPLMVAALGWGPLAATIGGIGAATGLGAIFGLPISIPFVVMMALPAWWLGHLALLGRPVANAGSSEGATPAPPVMEWYPVGRILLWIAGFGTLSTMATLLTLGTDAATITETLRAALLRVLGPRVAASGDEIQQRIEVALIDLARGRRHQRHDDADGQLLAGCPDHGDVGTTASLVARPEKHRAAADDARGIVGRHRILFFRRAACDAGARPSPRRC